MGLDGYGTGPITLDANNNLWKDNDFGSFQAAGMAAAKSGTISYSVSMTNDGPGAATNSSLEDAPPGDLSWSIDSEKLDGVEQGAGTNCSIGTHAVLSCSVSSLANGSTYAVVVSASIGDTSCTTTQVSNTVDAESDLPDPQSNNDSATVLICEGTSPPPA